MGEYIKLDTAYNFLTEYYNHRTDIQHQNLRKALNAIPTADVQPVVHGKWLWELADNGWANHICSICGYTKNTDIHVVMDYNFCPNCGARTDGE